MSDLPVRDLHTGPAAAGSPIGPSIGLSGEPSYRVARPRSGLDTGSKRLLMLAGGFGAALLLLIGGWSFTHRSTGAVPVIEADGRPLRVRPENPGGMQVVGLDEQVMNGGPSRVSAGPEAPAAIALRALQGGTAPGSPVPAQTVPSQAAPTQSPVAAAPVQAVPSQPAPPPGHSTAQAAAPAAQTTAPQAQTPPSPAPPAPAASPRIAASGSDGKKTLVQLAAARSESAASGEWKRLSKRMPDLLGGHQPRYQKVERKGRTIWRVRTGGFADVAQATAFCVRVKSKGVDCAVASF